MSFLPEPLHPAVVHFPIALTLAALLFELLGFFSRTRTLASAVPVLVLFAALGATAAVISGNWSEEEAVVPAQARAVLEQHEELGEKVMVGLWLLTALRFALGRLERFSSWVRVIMLLLLALAAGAVGWNGKLGGELVFRHGVGTQLSLALPSATPASRGHEQVEH